MSEPSEPVVANEVAEAVEATEVAEAVVAVEEIQVGLTDQEIDRCFTALKNAVKNTNVLPSTLTDILRYAMEVVELSNVKGSKRRELAIMLVRKVIDGQESLSDKDKQLCLDIVDSGVLSNTVDLVIDASKGKLDLNKVVELVGATVEVGADNCGNCFPFSLFKKNK